MLIQCERVANVELNVIRDVHNDDVHVIGDVLVVDVIQLNLRRHPCSGGSVCSERPAQTCASAARANGQDQHEVELVNDVTEMLLGALDTTCRAATQVELATANPG